MSATARSLGTVVRAERARRQLSQEALASLAGMHRNYLGAIERDEIRNPTLSTIRRIAAALDMPISTLFAECEAATR